MKKALIYFSIIIILLCSGAAFSGVAFSKDKKEDLEYILIQQAASGTLTKTKDDRYTLKMHSMNPFVIYFNNGSKRIAGFMTLKKYFSILNKEFADGKKTKLNAALMALKPHSHKPSNYVISIGKPYYKNEDRSIIYPADLLLTEKPLPSTINFKHMILFVDDVCASCGAGEF